MRRHTLRVELWFDGDDAKIALHSAPGASFRDVRNDMAELLLRLSKELVDGDDLCPASPLRDRPGETS